MSRWFWLCLLVPAIFCLPGTVCADAVIPAGSAHFSQAKPSFESGKLGTGSSGGSTVTNTYVLSTENRLQQTFCDFIIVLEDEKGKQIPAGENNDIVSVTVQQTKNGQLTGEPQNHPVSGNQTSTQVNLDPQIQPREGEEFQSGAQIKIQAKTNKTFNRLHVTVSKKPDQESHCSLGGRMNVKTGLAGTVSVPSLSTGAVIFVNNGPEADNAIRFARFELFGADLPSIESVSIDGATIPFSIEVDPAGKYFVLTGGALAPDLTMEIWVRFSEPAPERVGIFGVFSDS